MQISINPVPIVSCFNVNVRSVIDNVNNTGNVASEFFVSQCQQKMGELDCHFRSYYDVLGHSI